MSARRLVVPIDSLPQAVRDAVIAADIQAVEVSMPYSIKAHVDELIDLHERSKRNGKAIRVNCTPATLRHFCKKNGTRNGPWIYRGYVIVPTLARIKAKAPGRKGWWVNITPHTAQVALAMRAHRNTKVAGDSLGMTREAIAVVIRELEKLTEARLFERSKGMRWEWYVLDTPEATAAWQRIEEARHLPRPPQPRKQGRYV